ncbi:MAG: hypothetical protein AAF394_11685 [Planctomycetota bacterium]
MFDWFDAVGCYGNFVVPVLAIWAIASLYTIKPGCHCAITEGFFLVALVLIAVCTIRTVAAMEACWLVHTACLGVTVVAGVMRRPESTEWAEI